MPLSDDAAKTQEPDPRNDPVDEDDEDEGPDEYELDDFIVDGDEEDNEQQQTQRRKKKKKPRVSEKTFVLDKDDYDLLEDNNVVGVRRPNHGNNFKRLKKALDGAVDDIAEEVDRPGEEIDAGDEMHGFIVDDEDVNENGEVVRRRKSAKKLGQALVASSSAVREMREIFGDPEKLLSLRKSETNVDESDLTLEDEFEPLILSEKYMLPTDDKIRKTDIPERIQLSEAVTGPPPMDDKSIEEESNWIFNRLTSGLDSPLPGMDDVVKEIKGEEIGNVLRMMHVQKLEVPFISMYRKELCGSLLKDPSIGVQDMENHKIQWHKVLWAIHTLDRKWLLLHKRKSVLKLFYNKCFEEKARRIDDDASLALNRQYFESVNDALKRAQSEREVDDVDAKFNLHFPSEQLRRPKRKSFYNICYKAGLRDFANKFNINSEKFGLFLLREEMIQEDLEDAKETPEEVAASFTCQMFETPQDVLKGARYMVAVEIGCEPIVRKYVRTIFMEKATVSTTPTPEGNLSIDSSHEFSGVKWLLKKPISEFKDAQWLLIQKAEEERLLDVTIRLPETTQMTLLADAEAFFLSEGVSKSAHIWNDERKMILKDSFFTYVLPSLEKEARIQLTGRSKNSLLMEYGKCLWDKVSVAPCQIQAEGEPGTKVLACCWGPGQPATTFVLLDSAGEMMDLLYADSFGVRSHAVAEQQRKKSDQQRVLKFVIDHQPQVVCLGGANLSCRGLKDDLYEIFFKIVKDHPSEYFQDYHITILDESLSRLYENSRVSSDQLSGQSGIVRRAVGLGRYLQNPLVMVATLCGPDREILSWKLCPHEHFLTSDEKYEVVEQVMVDATNQVGVDFNLAASHEWLFAPLQFVSGLGPRKAAALRKAFVGFGSISSRKDIAKLVKKNVFINAAGFLRVRNATASSVLCLDPLDGTRIHPELYGLAKHVAKDCYTEDISFEPSVLDEMVVERVIERPELLRALDVDEYAKSQAEQSGTNKRESLYLIKMEMLHAFQDWRFPFKDLEPDEEFYLLSGETADSVSVGKIVQVTVRQIQENRIVCTFNSGLRAVVMAFDYSVDGINVRTLQIREGELLTAEIKSIDRCRYLVYLTCNVKYRSTKDSHDKLDPYYHEDTNIYKDQVKERKHGNTHFKPRMILHNTHFKPRMILHPRFQNLTADEAMKDLSEKDAGESIIRPSSKGPSFLTLTLKFYDGVYVHKDIVEGGKDPKDMTSLLRLGKPLTIGEETFEDLDEVMVRYVDPLVTHLKAMLGYRKFRGGTKTEVDELLRAEKAANPSRIVYCLGVSHQHPGAVILSYIRSSNPHHEYIELHPKGFRFRKKDFGDIDRLVAFFQRNIT